MLRKRVVTVLTFNDGVLYRTKLFRPDYRYTLNFVDDTQKLALDILLVMMKRITDNVLKRPKQKIDLLTALISCCRHMVG